MTSRRQFLAGLGAGLTAGVSPPARARPSASCGYDILQVFLFGGISHRDTLYVDDRPGLPDPIRVEPDMSALGSEPAGAVRTPFAYADELAGLDHDVYLGAGAQPLDDLGVLDQTRLLVMRGDFTAHTLASSFALTGAQVGQPEGTSLGARIQAESGDTSTPASWVLSATSVGRIAAMAAASGQLGAQYRPFLLPVGSDAVVDRLARSDRDHIDPVSQMYARQYDRRLTHADGRVRAPHFDQLQDSLNRLQGWQSVHGVLDAGPALAVPGNPDELENGLATGIHMGSHLLASGARHAIVVGGLDPALDTHSGYSGELERHARRHNGVLWSVCDAIRYEASMGSLDLSSTLVVIWSEFGRRLDSGGSQHHAAGYAAMILGGPVASRGLAGRMLFGSEAGDDGFASPDDHVTPTELHDALTLAAGLDASTFGIAEPAALATKVLGDDCTLPI
ncbi:MAG: DUF1501 domain-containing protein [Myxococcales bacterium]|nr:DUF1501 domain-containing protein [Myxococcales bacterium]